jgi:hypothetical protein
MYPGFPPLNHPPRHFEPSRPALFLSASRCEAAGLRSEESFFSLSHYVIVVIAFLFRLFVFLINLLNPARLIKRQIKHLVLPHQNLAKLFLLCQRHSL